MATTSATSRASSGAGRVVRDDTEGKLDLVGALEAAAGFARGAPHLQLGLGSAEALYGITIDAVQQLHSLRHFQLDRVVEKISHVAPKGSPVTKMELIRTKCKRCSIQQSL
jgi:hypothetical protein